MAKGNSNKDKATDQQDQALAISGESATTTTDKPVRAPRVIAALPEINTVAARSHLLRSVKRYAKTITIHGVDDDGQSAQVGEFDHVELAEAFADVLRDQRRYPVVTIQTAGK